MADREKNILTTFVSLLTNFHFIKLNWPFNTIGCFSEMRFMGARHRDREDSDVSKKFLYLRGTQKQFSIPISCGLDS